MGDRLENPTWVRAISRWVTDWEILPGCTSEDKVCRKDLCWSVRPVYVLEKLPDVSVPDRLGNPTWVHEWGQSVQKRLVLVCEASICSRKAVRCKRAQPRRDETLHARGQVNEFPWRFRLAANKIEFPCLFSLVSISLAAGWRDNHPWRFLAAKDIPFSCRRLSF